MGLTGMIQRNNTAKFLYFCRFSKKTNLAADAFAVTTRLELATLGVTGRYSNQLNYATVFLMNCP